MRNPELWERLREFRVDDGNPVLPFTARLARENGWSPNFAQRVFSEYRRFLYLAAVAGHVVTPSDHVDQAWHLHLAYTRSYWDTLCRSILNRPLHHDPTRGGESESSRFESCYERTLRSYEVEFGEAPPADIWPGPRDRFDHDAHARRVNTLDHWVIPKRTTTHAALVGALAVAPVLRGGLRDRAHRGRGGDLPAHQARPISTRWLRRLRVLGVRNPLRLRRRRGQRLRRRWLRWG
jgi:hypothetical protein